MKQLTSQNFNDKIKTGYCLVEFGAEWCAPCKRMHPILEKVKDKIDVYAIDIDSENQLANDFNIKSIPALVLFNNGKPILDDNGALQVGGKTIASKVGLVSESKLIEWIDNITK